MMNEIQASPERTVVLGRQKENDARCVTFFGAMFFQLDQVGNQYVGQQYKITRTGEDWVCYIASVTG